MRKTTDIIIIENEKELHFRIKQMSATQSESWTYRLLMLLAQGACNKSINDLKDNTDLSAVISLLGNVPFDKIEELLADLLKCCSIIKDNIEIPLNESNIDGFIEERNTLIKLRIEAFKYNNFFQMPETGGSKTSPDITTIKRRG